MNRQDKQIAANIEQTFKSIAVPQSLLDFADQVPDLYDQQQIHKSGSSQPNVERRSTITQKRMILRRIAGGCAAGLVIFIGSVLYSPSFAAYTKSIPGLTTPVEWLQQVAENIGIQNAKDHGYTPVHPVSINKEGHTFTIDNVFLEGNELRFMFAIQGPQGTTENFDISPSDFPDTPGSGGGDTKKISDIEELRFIHYKFELTQKQLEAFLAKRPTKLTFRIGQRGMNESFIMTVPFDQARLKAEKETTLNTDLRLQQKDPAIEHATIKSFSVYPTRIRVNIEMKLTSGYQINFARWADDEPYLTDEHGKKYEFENDSHKELYDSSGIISLDFVPSVYFDKQPKQLTLHLKKVWLTDTKASETVKVSTTKFPQTITTHGKTYTLTSAKREYGHWFFDVKKQADSLSNPFEGIRFELSPEVRQQMEGNWEWEEEIKQGLEIGDNGLIIPKYDRSTHKKIPGQFELNIFAAKQDTYTLNVRRYEDEIPLDIHIPLK
ncbi:DUF4179 domain-containing protein [Aneurinibacillus migulanus]|uniref:DUF4179 domain-containing protein n=1 Tax=Aneurinibacillus migulanus TaxID=47500 RepID=A0A0D1XZ13_ANEMI|nr:DUF4179 domain-containing protein [Aneurinibacillus migulanus]KIV52312.1 hypothetical protein TS65_23075 [Aneurinibacillus migulanus]KON94484.1 hypothetical protein AF333_02245 [Aneurinibacillus migulanus]MED0892509.1 DUF4179 domain-containing protein [Aneurinibacillus migulanus]MED1615077.1 DUF4179 domain-containing protein [Aneurinibacillus migulanus]SDI43903.1 protein of unknown function [Aneurinibacillus migulanus]